MQYTMLGRTRLRVSVAGLGGGGHSRLGLGVGKSPEDAVGVVRRALDLGVNFIDTAESYETEGAIGQAIHGHDRTRLCLCTKKAVAWRDEPLISAEHLRIGVEGSLSRLRTDYLDVFCLHAVRPHQYDHARNVLVPELLKLRGAGKIRFLGVTEEFLVDTGHDMLGRAVEDDCWDVMMVGFNLLNQSARQRVLPFTQPRGIGTLIMFAVRTALSRPDELKALIADLANQGRIDPEQFDMDDPLGFLTASGVADSVPEAAYRFCRHEPGADVVLFGTGNVEHVDQDVAAILKPPLPQATRDKLADIFARVDNLSGN